MDLYVSCKSGTQQVNSPCFPLIAAEKGKISFEKWKINAEANTPLGRFGDPLEYGALVAFLASDKADYMTGSSIAIDGGILRNIN